MAKTQKYSKTVGIMPNSAAMSGPDEYACDDVLCFDISDSALERAAAAIPGGAMSFPNAPTVSILIVCCSFND
jgi:hypothetical protein